MQTLALDRIEHVEEEPAIKLLVADQDAEARTRLIAFARGRVAGTAVLEADDGAEAIQIGLQLRPQIALLDVAMPRVGGFDAAITLRELRPQTRLALRTGDVRAHRDRARERRLPLFDKRDLDSTVDWLRVQADQWAVQAAPRSVTPRTRNFECPSCGYGIARAFPPERCPMCQREAAWTQTARRPFSRRA